MEELKKAPVTVFLILANILVFTAVEFTGGSEDTMHMLQLVKVVSFIPLE